MRPNRAYLGRIAYIALKKLRRLVAEEGPVPPKLLATLAADRPRYRSECVNGPRPCVYFSCRYHLGLEVTAAGTLRFPRADVPFEQLSESCALDVADRGPQDLRDIAHLLGLTKARVEQIERAAKAKLAAKLEPSLTPATLALRLDMADERTEEQQP